MYYQHVKSILSKEECETLIQEGYKHGFEKATVNYYGEAKKMDSIRNNERVEWDNIVLSKSLEEKLQSSLKEQFPHTFNNLLYSKANSHFRMYKYVPGQYFKPHKDGHYEDEADETEITVLFYLNDTDGGETILMPYGYQFKDDYIIIKPKQGDVLLFQHNCWHEGKPVLSGEKYVLRTDLFFKKKLSF